MTTMIVCPKCQQLDQVKKVSAIYMEGIGLDKKPSREMRSLSQKLAPPSGGKKEVIRSIHPDLMVAGFGIVFLFFFYQIVQNQRVMAIPALVILVLFFLFYFLARKTILLRYEREQQRKKDEVQQIETRVQRWMNLYYCGRDNGVFEPGDKDLFPLDQMPGFWSKP